MQSPSPEHVNQNEIVRAGAGAGKTYTLTHKVMDLAADLKGRENRWPRLIVTTFTRKATQELRERLMLLALEERPELSEFVNSRSNLVVSTIHGVMDLFLKRYGGKIGVDSSYSIIGPAEASKLARQVLRETLLGRDEDRATLEIFSFNRLIDLFRRLDRLTLENPDARPYQIGDFEKLFAQDAESAARELKAVAFKIKEESIKADWLTMAEEYIALAAILMASLGPGEWNERFADFETRVGIMKTARRNAKAPPVTDATADEAEAIRKRVKEFPEPFYDPKVWQFFCEQYQNIDRLARDFSTRFRAEKMQRGSLEIADLETLAMDCLRRFPETGVSFCAEWDHWLIDEYQDTSPFQVELLRKLSGQSPNFIVGDPQQSIYLFRGARSEVFSLKEKEILSTQGKQNFLKMNRRSRPELLLFLNDFFSRLEPPFQPMLPFVKEGSEINPSRRVATVYIDTDIDSGDEGENNANDGDYEASAGNTGGKSRLQDDVARVARAGLGEATHDGMPTLALTADRELRAVVTHVQSLLEQGARFEDICILGRTNRVLTEVATLLTQFHLPTHIHASSGFFDRREIRDALALLKFLVNPHDNLNLLELTRSPWFRVNDEVLVETANVQKSSSANSIWDSLQKLKSDAVYRLIALVESTHEFGYSETFRRALIESGFVDLSHRHDVSGRRESNLWKLLAKLHQEEGQKGFNPISFISAALHDLKVDEANSEGDAVAAVEPDRINLMTVHASKGLEFKHILLPRMHQKPRLTTNEEFTFDEDTQMWAARVPWGEDGDMTKSLPEVLWLRRFQKQELEEHARVLYVALTRAVESVFLSWKAPFQTHSWAEMIKLDLAEGDHRCASYSYFVTMQETTLQAPKFELQTALAVREPFQSAASMKAQGEAGASMSVTKILERAATRSTTHAAQALGPNHRLNQPMNGQTNEPINEQVNHQASQQANQQMISHRVKIAAEGTAVHRLMELLKYPSQIRLQQIVTKWFPGREDKILAGVEFVRDCQEPPLLEVINNGYVEWGFAMAHQGVVIEGQLDLWGRTNAGQVWIVDYKTGSPEYREKAFQQMDLYSIALRKSGHLKPGESIQLAAVFPFARKTFVRASADIT